MFEKFVMKEMEGSVLFVEEEQLFARMPDGRKVLVGADVDREVPFLTFEEWPMHGDLKDNKSVIRIYIDRDKTIMMSVTNCTAGFNTFTTEISKSEYIGIKAQMRFIDEHLNEVKS